VSGSPIVYRTTTEWKKIAEVSKQYFSEKSAVYHYYGTANGTLHDYLVGDTVRYALFAGASGEHLLCSQDIQAVWQ
jgi:predicted nucleotidyltransferase